THKKWWKRPASASSSVRPDSAQDDRQHARSSATERANSHLQGDLLTGSDTLALQPQTPSHGTADMLGGVRLKPHAQSSGNGQRRRQACLWYHLAPCGAFFSSQQARW